MSTDLILKEDLSMMVEQTKARVNAVQHIYKEIMQEGKEGGGDYGIIPGCGKKPSLLKAGAEKLIMAFRLSAKISDVMEINLPGGHREYRVLTSLFAPDGSHLADGTGMCSSQESKYRYRGGVRESTGEVVPTEYWNLKKAGKLSEAQAAIGGDGFGVMKEGATWVICKHGEKMENPDPADQFNTILKMAKKRSLIDAVLTGTGASDIFTQDIEDMNLGQPVPAEDKKPEPPPAQAATGDQAFTGTVLQEGQEIPKEYWDLRSTHPSMALKMLNGLKAVKENGKWFARKEER